MARILFVVPPLEGHVNPTLAVAAELARRGHDVAWAAHPGAVRPLLPEGATLLPIDDSVPADVVAHKVKAAQVRGLERLKFLYEDFLVPLARAMIPGVDGAMERFRPHLVVADQQTFAGALVANRRKLPWATFVTTSAGAVEPLADLPKVREWLNAQLAALHQETGGSRLDRPDLSPYLVVIFSSAALVGEAHFPPQFHFVGPAIGGRPNQVSFPWEWLGEKPRVLITLGTVNASLGERFFGAAIEAFAGRDFQIVMVAPETPPDSAAPDNVLVRSRVPQLELLPHMNAVVCHAGHNTVCEALANGLPLVLAPIKDDQSIVAQQVVNAGAGIRLKFGRVSSRQLLEAVETVLEKPSYREAAAQIRGSFESAGGSARAAALLETLV